MITFCKFSWSVLLLLSIFFIACNQKNNPKVANTTKSETFKVLSFDTLQYVVIPFDTSKEWLFDKNYNPSNLAQNEILEIDSLLNNCVAHYNNMLLKDNKKYYFIDLVKQNYKRQYVPVVNKKGEKEVWINCFCQPYGVNWKKSLEIFDGGGNCYFNFKVNLTTKTCYNFWVNAKI